MIKTFILIMVIGQGGSQGGNTSFHVEFNDEASCIKAMRIIKSDIEKSIKDKYIPTNSIISHGCYPKGE